MQTIIKQLKKYPDITDWRLVHQQATRYQLYIIGSELENVRKVTTNKYFLTIYSRVDDRVGSTTLTVFDHEKEALDDRLKPGVFIAQRVTNPLFSLPGPAYVPFVESFDPTLAGDIQEILFVKLADQMIATVEKEKDVTLSSSEFFVDLEDLHMRNSRGIDIAYKRSGIFFDGVLLAGDSANEVEMHFEPRSRRYQDVHMERTIKEYAQFARDSLTAELPPKGHYPVVLSGNGLSAVFIPMVHHTSASSQYRKTSRFRPGQSIYQEGQPKGEPLTLISNGYVPFGLRTLPVDADGVPACRTELIRDGQFVRPWSSKRYADYLGIPPTGAIANLEIPIGSHSTQDILSGERVLQVVEFSALMPNSISGNFAAEIKLGYLHENGKSRPIKGGSVSGNLITGFSNVLFSTEAQFANYALALDNFGSYIGPRHIRFHDFQVSGR